MYKAGVKRGALIAYQYFRHLLDIIYETKTVFLCTIPVFVDSIVLISVNKLR